MANDPQLSTLHHFGIKKKKEEEMQMSKPVGVAGFSEVLNIKVSSVWPMGYIARQLLSTVSWISNCLLHFLLGSALVGVGEVFINICILSCHTCIHSQLCIPAMHQDW